MRSVARSNGSEEGGGHSRPRKSRRARQSRRLRRRQALECCRTGYWSRGTRCVGLHIMNALCIICAMPIRPHVLSDTNWKTVRDTAYSVAVLPWGATEPHNFHLPFATDVYEATAVAERAAEIAWA